MEKKETELKDALKALGWREVYVHGHGDTEAVSEGDFVIGDIEKSVVMIPPKCVWDEPVPYLKYF